MPVFPISYFSCRDENAIVDNTAVAIQLNLLKQFI